MRTAKVTVKKEVGTRRPIRVHLTITEAGRLANILQDTDFATGYSIDGHDFSRNLSDAIDEAGA